MLIRAYYLNQALQEVENAKEVVAQIVPKGEVNFLGLDEQYIYFTVVARASDITTDQKRDLREKTRFIEEEVTHNLAVFSARYKMIVHTS